MVGGRLCCMSCLLTCNAVLLLGVWLHDVEASSCQRVIHKKVGDTVELSSCSPAEGVTVAQWKYGQSIIADRDEYISEHQFKDRLHLNLKDFSLTVKNLILQDSGDFSFLSEVNNKQRETVIITLQVHEPITTKPTMTINSTWHTLNESCTFLLECSGPSVSNVTYNWTVRNQARSGSRLQYIIRAQDGDTKFTCTVRNAVSEMSASKTVECSNNTQEISTEETRDVNFVVLLGAAVGGCLMVVIVIGIAVAVYYIKQSRAGSNSDDLTVYSDVAEVANEDGTSSAMKSVYETINNKVNSVTPGPQTVYDKIQLSRVREASVSPYQDIS